MIDALSKVCKDNLIENKLLLVPSYQIGQNIIKRLTEKTPILNLRIETIIDIATQIAMPLLSSKGYIFADDSISRQILFAIIYNMHKNGEFEYFTNIQATPSISNSIWNAIMEIKYADIVQSDFSNSSFVSVEKGSDISKIIVAYDLELQNQGLVDYPGILKMALDSDFKQDGLLLIPNSINLRFLEKKFIAEKFAAIKILYGNKINSLDVPKSYYSENYPTQAENQSPFVNLFALEKQSAETDYSSISLIKAFGDNNEIEAVLRDVIAKQIPFDNVCIYTASKEPYSQLMYQKMQQLKIPVTFGYGVNIQNSKPGKAFRSIIDWIGSDYRVTDFISMLYQELIEIPSDDNENINPYQAANTLRASGIGWGRERYAPILADLTEDLQSQRNMKEEYRLNKLRIVEGVKLFVESLFTTIPEAVAGKMFLNKLAKGISSLIKVFVPQKSQLDAEAKIIITETLNQLSLLELLVDIDEALSILKSYILSIRIGVSGPKEGHIHICSSDNEFFINRQHNYFIGFDSDRFPGKVAEDAILLDVEKQRLSNNILQNRQRANERVYRTTELLSDLKGNITLIYSSFDTAENRQKTPSSFMLQLFRMISRKPSADYSDLHNHFKITQGYITANAIDESGYWLEKCFHAQDAKNKSELIFQCYPHLKQGVMAWDNRSSEKFTCYDGYVDSMDIEIKNKVFSASKLELLAKCPYQYFLRYVLNISPPDEITYDPEIWLDPLQKGTLYHSIFEKFYKTISERKEKPNKDKHSSLIVEIAKSEINEFKKQIPPPDEVVFDVEVKDILESCIVFLTSEEENSDDGVPIEFELGFGIKDESYPPVEVTLPSENKFLLSGKIDRIDRLSENTYRIIDYKSGGTYGFSDRDFFKGGRQIQHALYAYACETILRNEDGTKNAKVQEGVYSFPTKKGEGRRFTRVQRENLTFLKLLDDLFMVIGEGIFAATEEQGDCRWCDYKIVCRIHRLEQIITAKRHDESVEALSVLRRLNEYE